MRMKQLISNISVVVVALLLTISGVLANDSASGRNGNASVDAESATDAEAEGGDDIGAQVPPAEESNAEPRGPRFRSVGILPVQNETRVMHGGEQVMRILLGRLERKFRDVKFVRIDPEEDESYPGGPILLTEAKRLGEKHQVDALIDGTFLGYEVSGGTWPSRATIYPEARAIIRLRVIRTSDGTLFKYYTHKPKKMKTYSPSIRTERELFGRVVRDAIDELAKQMKQDGVFWEPERKE